MKRLLLACLVVANVAAVLTGAPHAGAHHLTTVRPITFPAAEGSTYTVDFHAPRGRGTRLHKGTDIFAPKMTPLLAARDGVIDRMSLADRGLSGNYLVITDDEGWEYLYIHLNNDTPGTDDGANDPRYAVADGIEVGARVTAGQVVGYLGDSGNAEETPPHVHFEIRRPDGTSINPWPSLRTAQQLEIGEQCIWSRNPAPTPALSTDQGLWATAADGTVAPFGPAPHLGDLSDAPLNAAVLGITPTPTGGGYWLVAADGGIFSFGDAEFFGSTGDVALNAPVVGMVPTDTGGGYWLVAADGGVFTFGDATFVGSLPGLGVEALAVGVATRPSRDGYWVLTGEGGVYPFGEAGWHGSVASAGLCTPRDGAAIWPTDSGQGYWILTTDGRLWAYGDAPALASSTPVSGAVAVAGRPADPTEAPPESDPEAPPESDPEAPPESDPASDPEGGGSSPADR